jgi:hypothetical protein
MFSRREEHREMSAIGVSQASRADTRRGRLLYNLIPVPVENSKHYFVSRFSLRSCSRLIKASAPPDAMTDANSSRRMARSLMVPLR